MSIDEDLEKKRHMMYYNQLLQQERREKLKQSKIAKKKKKVSFGAQEVDFKEYVFVPEGYEFLTYALYVVCVPYLVGAVFLFFFVAGGDFDNFMLLRLNAFMIVWLIGYEIVAAFLLSWIFILYLQYEEEDE